LTWWRQFAIIHCEAAALDSLRAADGVKRIAFRISILASGSSGNSTLLESEHTALLVDAGLGKKEMLRRFEALGRQKPDHLDGILISHEHTDHSNGLGQLQREWKCLAYLTEPTHREIKRMLENQGIKKTIDQVQYVHPGEKFEIGDIEVTPFAIPHDASDPVGYCFKANGIKVAIVTDLGYLPELVKHHLREADFLILESNHDLEMLKVGPYPWHIKQRVMSRTGHLSNATVSEFLSDCEVFDGRARHLVLAHLSEQNNNPSVARISAEEALGRRAAEFAFSGTLHIASQHTPLGPFEL
jgi:phosphoribosyl 1,2-cyclic phosphodiesterase